MTVKKRSLIILFILNFLMMIAFTLSGCGSSPPSGDNSSNNNKEITETEVIVYFGDFQAEYLVPEKHTVKTKDDTNPHLLAEIVINELIAGPYDKSLNPTIPPETRLLSIEIKDKIAYVDFSPELKTNHWGGTAGETMTITSIVNTLTELENIDKVQILIEGEKQDSLAGHWYIGDPLERDEKIIKK